MLGRIRERKRGPSGENPRRVKLRSVMLCSLAARAGLVYRKVLGGWRRN